MADSKPAADNHRIGMAKDRSQVLNTKTGKFTKRDSYAGQHIDQKNNEKPRSAPKKKYRDPGVSSGGSRSDQDTSPCAASCVPEIANFAPRRRVTKFASLDGSRKRFMARAERGPFTFA